jgi:hypothetical protein
LSNGVTDFRERTRQLAAPRLRGSRDSEHKKNDISFILNPSATKFLRGVCKDMKQIVVEGHGHWSDETMRICMPTSSCTVEGLHRQQAQERVYLFHLGFFGHEILRRRVQLNDQHHDQRAR